MKFDATKDTKGFRLSKRPEFDLYVNKLEEGTYTVSVEKKKSKRSLDSNSYYWHLIEIVSQYFREQGTEADKNTLHEVFKLKFLSLQTLDPLTSEVVTIARQTKDLSQNEFSSYMEEIKRWCAINLDLVLPEPNEIGFT